MAATWFIQQHEEIKRDWPYLHEQLVQQFANNDVTQTTLQQLDTLRQQPHEPVAQFAVKLKQLLLRVDPHMKETMKLYFLLPRPRYIQAGERSRTNNISNGGTDCAMHKVSRLHRIATCTYTITTNQLEDSNGTHSNSNED